MSNYSEFDYRGYKIVVSYDEDNDACNPRNADNLGTMWCSHRRYFLGDEERKGPDETLQKVKEIEKGGGEVLPLFLYDHSGLAMSTSNQGYPFNDPWDAGLVGFIFVSKEKMRIEYGHVINQKRRELARQVLQSEVEDYDRYLRGECFGYTIEDEAGEFVDSCWGFLRDPEEVEVEAKAVVDSFFKPKRRSRK